MAIKVVRNDITKMDTEAVVNTASSAVGYGPGIDSAIYKAAGEKQLLAERQKIGEVEEGEVFITPGFDLSAKYIIHVVSPVYTDGLSGEENKLRGCYRKALELARNKNIKSISFPLISTGSFGYPKADGLRIAIDECNAFLLENDMDIRIVVFDSKATMMAEKLFPKLESFIDHNYVCEKRLGRMSRLASAIGARKNSETPKEEKHKFGLGGSIFPDKSKAKSADAMMAPMVNCSYSISSPSMNADALKGSRDEEAEFDDFEDDIRERVSHMADPFGRYVMYLMKRKGKTSVEVENDAWLSYKTFSKLSTHQDTYMPKKRTACQLCVGLGLNYDESRDLLLRAGLSLSPSILEDVIWQFFFEMDPQEYDIFDVSDALESYGLKPVVVLEEKNSNCG